MNAKAAPVAGCKDAALINLILKAVPVAMGTAVVVTSLFGELNVTSGFTLLGIGMACIGIYLLRHKN